MNGLFVKLDYDRAVIGTELSGTPPHKLMHSDTRQNYTHYNNIFKNFWVIYDTFDALTPAPAPRLPELHYVTQNYYFLEFNTKTSKLFYSILLRQAFAQRFLLLPFKF